MSKKTVPITLISGFLGAGKTTLLNNILREPNGHKIAVIVNDIGEINIDAELIDKGSVIEEEDKNNDVVALSNGCICCTLKQDLITQITTLLKKNQCDYIVIEASGICEPLPIANTIVAITDALIRNNIPIVCKLDSIITVADAFRLADEFNCGEHFTDEHDHDEHEEEEEDLSSLLIQQIEFCNIVLLNKTDLVSEEQKNHIKAVVAALNPSVDIIETVHSKTDISSIVDTNAFDMQSAYEGAGWIRAMQNDETEHDEHDHDEHEHHHHHHDHEHEHHHDEGEALEYGINTCVYMTLKPFDRLKFEDAILKLSSKVIRSKGFVWFKELSDWMFIYEQCGKQVSLDQGNKWVAAMPKAEQMDVFAEYPEVADNWDKTYGDRLNRIVFIGQGISKEEITKLLDSALAEK